MVWRNVTKKIKEYYFCKWVLFLYFLFIIINSYISVNPDLSLPEPYNDYYSAFIGLWVLSVFCIIFYNNKKF